MQPAKMLLTGGHGFIGKCYTRLYQAQYQLTAPTRAQLELTDALAVEQYLQESQPAIILQAATRGVSRSETLPSAQCFQENLRAFANICKSMPQLHTFINLGSGAEYARPLRSAKIREEAFGQHIPTDDYGLVKYLSSRLLQATSIPKKVTLHFFGVFGPYEDFRTRFISNAIVRLLNDLPIVINQDVVFDYLFVEDAARIINEFVQRPPLHFHYNVASGESYRLTELAEIINALMKSHRPIIVKNRQLASEYTADVTRMREFLPPDWSLTPIEHAIKQLIAWYESAWQQAPENFRLIA